MMSNLCDLAMILQHGRLCGFGTAKPVVDAYFDTYHHQTPANVAVFRVRGTVI